jgi:phosphonate transport system substrate-binding protein
MKQTITLLFVMLFTVAVTACGQTPSEEATALPAEEAAEATAPPAEEAAKATEEEAAEAVEEEAAEVAEEEAAEAGEPAEEEAAEAAEAAEEEAAASASDEKLVLAFIPQENPEKLLGDIDEIGGYLTEELGFTIEGFVTQDHAAAVEALRNGDADISFMGALPYVLAHDQTGAEVILAEVYRGSPEYTGRIFVRKDSGIETLEDLKGKSIAFADPISESGYLYPLDEFVQAGLLERGADPQSFFSTVYFAGGYQQSLQAVLNGFVDAAGASQYAEFLVSPDQLEEITWIAETDPIPSHVVLVRKGLESKQVEAFKQAMLKLNEPEYKHLLKYVYSPDGYVEATHDDYASVEEMARLYGFIK